MQGSAYDSGSVLAALILAVALAALNKAFFRSEGESLATIGFDNPWRRLGQFGAAFLAGCGVVALWTIALLATLHPRWRLNDGFNGPGALARIAFCLFNNAGEELAYRAYLLKQLAQRFGATTAVLATSALFALLHVQAGVPWLSAATVVFTSGVLFAVLLLRWKSLPLVIGFHVATNVAQECIGLRVTGLSFVRPAFDSSLSPLRQTSALVAVAVINVAIATTLVRTLRAPRETT